MPPKVKLTKAEKEALKQKEKEAFEFKLKEDKLERELAGNREQISEVRRKVFEQAQIINLPIIKEEWLHKWGFFERTIDWKDFYISQLRDDIYYYELHQRLLEENHNENIDKLVNIYQDGINRIMDTYNTERTKLLRDRKRQETRLVLTQERRSENMEAIIFRLLEGRQKELDVTNWENQKEHQMKIFRYEESVARIAQDGDEEIKELWFSMKGIFDKYKTGTYKKRQEYLIMKQRDIIEKNNLDQLIKRIASLHRTVRQCKARLSKLKLDEGLREEVDMRRATLERMKQEVRQCNEQDLKQIENLCLLSNAMIEKLTKMVTKMTGAITLLSIAKRLESPLDKVAPKLYASSPLELFKNNSVMPLFDDLEQLWAKTLYITSVKEYLASQLQDLESENAKLQNRLKAVLSKSSHCHNVE